MQSRSVRIRRNNKLLTILLFTATLSVPAIVYLGAAPELYFFVIASAMICAAITLIFVKPTLWKVCWDKKRFEIYKNSKIYLSAEYADVTVCNQNTIKTSLQTKAGHTEFYTFPIEVTPPQLAENSN